MLTCTALKSQEYISNVLQRLYIVHVFTCVLLSNNGTCFIYKSWRTYMYTCAVL